MFCSHFVFERHKSFMSIASAIFLLENLIDSGFGHRKLEEDSEEAYHDQRPWCPHDRGVTKLYKETQHLEHLQNHR